MSKFETPHPRADGWTDWINTNNNLRLACCDCRLSHDIEFDLREGQVYIRVRRNNHSTGQFRRKWKNGL